MNVEASAALYLLIGAVALVFVGQQVLRRWNRSLIAEANRTLRLPIPEIQYTNRREIIERLLEDKELQRRVGEQVEKTGLSAATLQKRCLRYAREIVPSFSAVFYFRVGYWLARVILQSLYRVHVRIEDSDALDKIERGSSVVLVMNHRSNMDILLVTYLASRQSTLINTAGEWARMWPLYFFVHWAGDCITDRDAKDDLYKYLYKAFIQMMVRERANIAIYPEGELSRDGKMRPVKFGLLSYCLSADPSRNGDLYLIPVGVNYDRIPEEAQLLADPDTAYRRQGKLQTLGSIFIATAEYVTRFLLPGRGQFGNACASFGRPIALRDWQKGRGIEDAVDRGRYEWVSALGNELIDEVSRLIPVLPSHVLATILASEANDRWSLQAIEEEGTRLMQEFRDHGGVGCIPDKDQTRAFADAVEDFTRRKLVSVGASGELKANPGKMPVLRYMANSVSHLLASH